MSDCNWIQKMEPESNIPQTYLIGTTLIQQQLQLLAQLKQVKIWL